MVILFFMNEYIFRLMLSKYIDAWDMLEKEENTRIISIRYDFNMSLIFKESIWIDGILNSSNPFKK